MSEAASWTALSDQIDLPDDVKAAHEAYEGPDRSRRTIGPEPDQVHASSLIANGCDPIEAIEAADASEVARDVWSRAMSACGTAKRQASKALDQAVQADRTALILAARPAVDAILDEAATFGAGEVDPLVGPDAYRRATVIREQFTAITEAYLGSMKAATVNSNNYKGAEKLDPAYRIKNLGGIHAFAGSPADIVAFHKAHPLVAEGWTTDPLAIAAALADPDHPNVSYRLATWSELEVAAGQGVATPAEQRFTSALEALGVHDLPRGGGVQRADVLFVHPAPEVVDTPRRRMVVQTVSGYGAA